MFIRNIVLLDVSRLLFYFSYTSSSSFFRSTGSGGIDTRMASRPDLYNLLLKQIPPQKIHMGKRVLSTEQGGNGVMVRCGDKSTYEGDILVGADGAYSSIRQCMYQNLKKRRCLLSSDDKPIPFTSVCMLGQTRPLDPSKFPHLNDAVCRFSTVIATNRSYSVWWRNQLAIQSILI